MNEQYLLSLMTILITLPFHGHHIVKAFKAKGKNPIKVRFCKSHQSQRRAAGGGRREIMMLWRMGGLTV